MAMSEVQRYYLSAAGHLIEGEGLGRLGVYLAADYDQLKADSEVVADLAESRLAENLRLKAERDQLKAELDRLRDVQILLNTERALVEQLEEWLDEAMEVIKEMRYACTDKSEAMADAWLEALI